MRFTFHCSISTQRPNRVETKRIIERLLDMKSRNGSPATQAGFVIMYISENFSPGCQQSSSIRTNSVNTEQDTIKLVYNHQISHTYQPSRISSLATVVSCLDFGCDFRRECGGWKIGHSHGERMHCDSWIDVEKLSIDASKFDTCGWVAGASWFASKASSLIATVGCSTMGEWWLC